MENIKTFKVWLHFTGYFLCFIIGGIISVIPRFIIGFQNESGLLVFITELLRIPITLILLIAYTKYVSKIPINKETLNINHFKLWKWLLIGLLLPIITISIFFITNNLTVAFTNNALNQSIIVDDILKSLGMSLAAGILEEAVFRGYLVNLLSRKYSLGLSVIIPSLLFTLLHIGAANSIINALQLLIAGMFVSIMFFIIYKKTGSVWNASVVHFIWNFIILNKLFNFGSGNISKYALLQFGLGQNSLFNGGEFGIEASIPAIIVYGITGLILWKLYNNKSHGIKIG